MTTARVAVLMTCHNRREKTLASLEALYEQVALQVEVQVYLVDDGSTDGTAAAIQVTYPQVNLLQGDGSLFWNGGMRLAFAEALKSDYDYYLWLNDDTLLYPEALGTLLATSRCLAEQGYIRAIVTGSTCAPTGAPTGVRTYGGVVRGSWLRPLQFHAVEPGEEIKPCDTMNGNCVLIPQEAVQVVGNLDPAFSHYIGDYDYGLRARQQGCTVWVAPGFVGTCSSNPSHGRMTATVSSWRKQWQKIGQPKGLALEDATLQPFKEWKVFAGRHGGPFWPIYWLLPYRRLLLHSVFGRARGIKA